MFNLSGLIITTIAAILSTGLFEYSWIKKRRKDIYKSFNSEENKTELILFRKKAACNEKMLSKIPITKIMRIIQY